jgi:undecaprenyl diphosphate synthase
MCQKLRIREISIYIDILDTDPALKKEMEEKITASLKDMFSGLPVKPRYTIYNNEGVPEATGGDEPPDVNILAGFGGKKEITKAVCSILEAVETGELSPEDITGGLIEQNLTIKSEPDLIIRAGGKHLSDFLIWQSVYSELYFTDVSWENFRKIDFYRIIRDFQKRQRRYGK